MLISKSAQRLVLSLHVLSSVGWAGALAVFLAHAAASLWSSDPQTARALGLAMAVTAWMVILPLSLASLGTGVAQALLSTWGLLRHHWVAMKLALTAMATAVLLMKLGPIDALAAASALPSGGDGLRELKLSLVLHAAGGLVVLVAATLLAVFKPVGLTQLGARGTVRERAPAPRWARLAWAGAGVLALLVLAMLLIGGHGPSAHVRIH